jgi:uncharacterized cupin superfamily protein
MRISLETVVPEAPLERNETAGLYPAGDGWFVVNARDAQWFDSVELGLYAPFEGEHARFEQLGVNLSVLRPGEPACMYHREEAQEGFLILSGEALLVIEGEERSLRRWDYVHCPEWTEHVVIGAGSEPCVILSVGARKTARGLVYPVNETAAKHGASVEEETGVPAEAYARFSEPKPTALPSDVLP